MKISRSTSLFILIAFIFLFFNGFLLFNGQTIWWDSAVYVGMGKYLWSQGSIGLWEAARPPLLPFILGFSWQLGFDPILFGKLLALSFSTGVLVLIYLLSKEISSPHVGVLATFFTAFSSTYFFFSTHIMTSIPSLFFLLLGLLLFWRNFFFLAGIFFGISFLTRFFTMLPILLLLLLTFLFFYRNTPRFWFSFLQSCGGFSLLLAPFLILNFFTYQDALFPFILQTYLSKETGLPYLEPVSFYLINLFKENPFFLLIGLAPLYLKQKKKMNIIFWLIILTLLFYSTLPHKEMRLILILYPFMTLLVAHIAYEIMTKLGVAKFFLYLPTILWIGLSFPTISTFHYTLEASPLESFLNLASPEDVTWISDPRLALHKDSLFGLLYYPYQQLPAPTLLLLNTCHFKGNSLEYTSNILHQTNNFLKDMKKESSFNFEGCTYAVFTNE